MNTVKNKRIRVFDIPNQKYLGKINLSEVNRKYDEWRSKGYGVLIDRDGCICLDNEDSEDDEMYYQEQINSI